MTYELHPLCTFFPRIVGLDFDALINDIEANGLREPIVLHDGMILDGGNRYRACIEAGVEPRFVEFAGGDPVSFVLSANLHRRHLTAGQQAAIVASATNWGQAHRHGGDRKSDQAATLPLDSIASRAAASGASERTQRMADKVAREAPELAKEVAHGNVSLPKAVEQIAPKTAKPKPAPEPDESDELRSRIEELSANLAETLADNEAMAKTFEADDKLAASEAECKRLRSEVGVLRQRVNGLMNEKNEAIKAAKSWQRKYEKLAKETGRA